MQNRNPNIDERLQILNDYIQRTIDALNVTRQVAQSLVQNQTGVQQNVVGGLSHTGFVPQQVVQTPYGFVTISPMQQFVGQVPQQFVGQVPQQVGFGLNHSQFVPQMQMGQIPSWPVQVVPQVGYGYGVPQWNVGGLNHTPWNQQVVGYNTLGYNTLGINPFVPGFVPNVNAQVSPNFGTQTVTPNLVGTPNAI